MGGVGGVLGAGRGCQRRASLAIAFARPCGLGASHHTISIASLVPASALTLRAGQPCFHLPFSHLRIILMGQGYVFPGLCFGMGGFGGVLCARGRGWRRRPLLAIALARTLRAWSFASPPAPVSYVQVLPRLDAKPGYSLFISSGDFLANIARGVSKYLCRG